MRMMKPLQKGLMPTTSAKNPGKRKLIILKNQKMKIKRVTHIKF
jgi:hypothetical protein